jgi:hypothetical protein
MPPAGSPFVPFFPPLQPPLAGNSSSLAENKETPHSSTSNLVTAAPEIRA